MVCLYCRQPTKVTNSRYRSNSLVVWRRRRCQSCQVVFTTTESAINDQNIKFLNKNGRLQPFSRDKLFISIFNSLKHRKNAVDEATALTDTVVIKLTAGFQNATLSGSEIITVVQAVLANFDQAAATHYSAYHPI